MLFHVYSDLHANLQAFEAVRAASAGQGAMRLCLGDIVGYGAQPKSVFDAVMSDFDFVVQGNHEDGAMLFRNNPAYAMTTRVGVWAGWERAANQLTPRDFEIIRQMQRRIELQTPGGRTLTLTHGTLDNLWGYLETATQIRNALDGIPDGGILLAGHTHCPGVWNELGHEVPLRNGVAELQPGLRYLVNPGSVGQPRTDDLRASFASLEVVGSRARVEFHQVEYDAWSAAAEIVDNYADDDNGYRLLDPYWMIRE